MRGSVQLALVGVCASMLLPVTSRGDTRDEVEAACGGCHALDAPDYDSLGIEERAERNGPPLFYAGNKFREEWLAAWLAAPERIRPAGVFAPAHTVATDEGDIVDESTLIEHPALEQSEAEKVAGYLMTLRPYDDLLAAQTYEPGTIALRMGQMNFSKFKGCDSCHQDEPDYGGVSGPELYTAWARLQPAFISAYIADPTAFDPHSMMPVSGLNDTEVHKLADYLKALAEADQ
jgi:mono/diheme cytochrome c family protein